MLITERDADTVTDFKKLLFSLAVVGLNWNVYSAKLNRMNSIENKLHSSTGHFKINIRGR